MIDVSAVSSSIGQAFGPIGLVASSVLLVQGLLKAYKSVRSALGLGSASEPFVYENAPSGDESWISSHEEFAHKYGEGQISSHAEFDDAYGSGDFVDTEIDATGVNESGESYEDFVKRNSHD